MLSLRCTFIYSCRHDVFYTWPHLGVCVFVCICLVYIFCKINRARQTFNTRILFFLRFVFLWNCGNRFRLLSMHNASSINETFEYDNIHLSVCFFHRKHSCFSWKLKKGNFPFLTSRSETLNTPSGKSTGNTYSKDIYYELVKHKNPFGAEWK